MIMIGAMTVRSILFYNKTIPAYTLSESLSTFHQLPSFLVHTNEVPRKTPTRGINTMYGIKLIM